MAVIKAREERIYSLRDFAIPPEAYVGFLQETFDAYAGFLKDKFDFETVPDANIKEKPEGPVVNVYPHAEISKKKVIGVVSCRFTDYIYPPERIALPETSRNFYEARESLPKVVTAFAGELDHLLPDREGKVPISVGEKNLVTDYRFGIDFKFRSLPSCGDLEAEVALRSNGLEMEGTSPEDTRFLSMPAISIGATGNFGSKYVELCKNLVQQLGNVVEQCYNPGSLEERSIIERDI